MLTSIFLFQKCQTSEMSAVFVINPLVVGVSVLIIYGINIIFGLLPLVILLKNNPASIFSRHDI